VTTTTEQAETGSGAAREGTTLAASVREILSGISWSRARDLVRAGRVAVDGAVELDPARRLAGGEEVEIRRAGRAAERGPLLSDALVHIDAEVVVVRKPAGLLTVPFDDERDTLVSLARVALARRLPRGTHVPGLRVVQRLDKETSGLLVFARTVTAERHLQQQLRHHTVVRRYLAVAHGEVADTSWDTLLVPDRGDGLRGSWGVFRKPRGEPPIEARRAVTYATVEKRLEGATLLSCRLETGRQHQIRIHLAEAGHPLVGEKVYIRDYRGPLLGGGRRPPRRPLLHAVELGFVHPRTGRDLHFTDPPPADFQAAVERLRGR
jgi:23S rRNA pseudouridine1911/1915/1917 synthase